MISVAPEVPPVRVHQCQLNSAHQCHNATNQCIPVHINATNQCPSELPFSVTYQCHLTVPVSAAYQCYIPVLLSAAFQCPSVMPVNAHQYHLPVPPHQCHLSVSISASYQCPSLQPHLAYISEGEKSLIYKNF
ncbi:unnamed protein product [Staurois parvus]|uniref:Uncharacterized protein n=1 Tax=Staurois parvus TaxID=386267 RepID=A0ABN9DDZ6_9NEOB|nr:unnamed protein product [Staurois parvus]